MGRFRHLRLALACAALVGFTWWLDAPVFDPTPDRTLETATARRERLNALLDREVRVDAQDEPVGRVIERLCQTAGVRVSFQDPKPIAHPDGFTQPLGFPFKAPVTLRLPHPIRLRSALALLAPSIPFGFVGEELQFYPTAGALHVHPIWFLSGDLAAWDHEGLLGSPIRDLSTPSRIGISIDAEPTNALGRLVQALDAAGHELPEPALIEETEAGRLRQQAIADQLKRVIDLELEQVTLEQALAQVQSQISVNLFVNAAGPHGRPQAEPPRISLTGRLPAGTALGLLWREGPVVPLHDVVALTSDFFGYGSHETESLQTKVHPIGHLFRVGDRWRLDDVIHSLIVSEESGRLQRLLRENPVCTLLQQALIVRQRPDAHELVERTLALLEQAQSPNRLRPEPAPAPGSPADILQQPARPLPGPLGIKDLAAALRRQGHACVVVDEQARFRKRSGDWRSDDLALASLLLPGDAGEGTIHEQLARMLDPDAAAVVRDGALVLTTRREMEREWSLQWRRIIEPELSPELAARVAQEFPRRAQPGVVTVLESLLVSGFQPADASTHWFVQTTIPVGGGTLLHASEPFHRLQGELLAAGHPFLETWLRFFHGKRSQRRAVLARALTSRDPYVAGLGVWLCRLEDPSRLHALQRELAAVIRTPFGPEFRRASLARDVWRLLQPGASPEELAAIVQSAAAEAPVDAPLLALLAEATRHEEPEVVQAAFLGIAVLPARAAETGDDCYLDPDIFLAGLERPDAKYAVRTAVEAYASYYLRRETISFGGYHWFMRLHAKAPYLKDCLKPALAQPKPRSIVPEQWWSRSGALGVYLEMLDDDEPELRRFACRMLLEHREPPPELVERLKPQAFDPATADLLDARARPRAEQLSDDE